MRRLYVALRSGMEENKKLCAEEFEEYLKQETRPIEQCRSDTHAIILYLVRKVKSKEKMEKILVPEKALDAVYRSKSKAALAGGDERNLRGYFDYFGRRTKRRKQLVKKGKFYY